MAKKKAPEAAEKRQPKLVREGQKDFRKGDVRYITRIPDKPLPKGRVLVHNYELQVFTCSACHHTIERIVDAYGNPPEKLKCCD